jgi:hypothetical protein
MTNEEIAGLILPWAKAQHPEKYAATLQVATVPATFRRYLIRLIEIRHAEAPGQWINDVALAVLEESAVTMRFRHGPTRLELEVKGRLAKPRQWTFVELQALLETPDEFARLLQAKTILDLEHVEG